ncbi:MAG: RNA methyltransferase [Bacteroidales bacterium]
MKKLSMDQLQRISAEEYKKARKFPVVIVLDNVRSMMNIGSVFRTADAFRVEKIFLCGITAKPPHKEIHKTALGATESVEWTYYENTVDAIADLQQKDFQIIALEQTSDSKDLRDFKPLANTRYAFVFGNEVKGVDDEVLVRCDSFLEIPQFGTKHSFNISVSAGIVLWDVFSKMNN